MGTEERREREKQARQGAILASARELFFTKGFAATTMDEIAHRAELSKGALYLYFPSKEALYATVLNEGLRILFDRLDEVFDLPLPPDQLLRRISEVHYRYYLDYPEYSRIFFFREHREATRQLPRDLLRDDIERGRRTLRRFSEVIHKGVEEGVFAQVDPWLAAMAFWGAANGVLFLFEEELNREVIGVDAGQLFFYTIELFIAALKKGEKG